MPLTDTTIRQTKAQARPFKLADGQGLYQLGSGPVKLLARSVKG